MKHYALCGMRPTPALQDLHCVSLRMLKKSWVVMSALEIKINVYSLHSSIKIKMACYFRTLCIFLRIDDLIFVEPPKPELTLPCPAFTHLILFQIQDAATNHSSPRIAQKSQTLPESDLFQGELEENAYKS